MSQNDIKLFKYVLVRSSPKKISHLSKLILNKSIQKLEEEYEITKHLEEVIEQNSVYLFKIISTTNDTSTRRILLTTRRSIYNKKYLSPKLLLRLKTILSPTRYTRIVNYNSLVIKLHKSEEEFIKTYQNELVDKQVHLNKLVQDEDLLKGIILASRSLYNNRKKRSKQIQRGLIKYISRMYTKTSPFSTFTKVGLVNIEDLSKSITHNSSLIRLNINLLVNIKHYLLQFDFLKDNYKIRVNPTIKSTTNKYSFFTIQDSGEFFQTIKKTPLLQYVYTKLKANSDTGITYKDFIKYLEVQTKEDSINLKKYIDTLIEYGFIDMFLPVSILDPEWDNALIQFLKPFTKDHASILNVYNSIEKIQTLYKDYNKFPSKLRVKIIDQAYREIQHLTTLTKNIIPLFYEDVSFKSKISLEKKRIDEVVKNVNTYIYNLFPYEKYILHREKLKDLFLSKHGKQKTVNIIQFYEEYSQSKFYFKDNKTVDYSNNLLFEVFNKEYGTKTKIYPSVINLNLKHVTRKYIETDSFSAFIQLFREGNNEYAVLNNVTSGFGKVYSRFLPLFPNVVTKDLHQNNELLFQSKVTTAIIDSTITNSNLHPILTSFLIGVPNIFNHLAPGKQIHLRDINVSYNKQSNSLMLEHSMLKKEVICLNLEMVNTDIRNPFFQFMNLFSPQKYFILSSLLELINKKYILKNNSIKLIPRILINNKLVVQRKTWIFPKNELLILESIKIDSTFFQSVTVWKKKYEIPDEVFIRITSSDDSIGDDYKPQYIHFGNPFLVMLFKNLLAKTKSELYVTEMLPNSQMLTKELQTDRVTEFVVQWDNRN